CAVELLCCWGPNPTKLARYQSPGRTCLRGTPARLDRASVVCAWGGGRVAACPAAAAGCHCRNWGRAPALVARIARCALSRPQLWRTRLLGKVHSSRRRVEAELAAELPALVPAR